MKLSIAKDKIHFEQNGKPFFWLADTLWSAFTNLSESELDSYLTLRAQQGFNVLQINILPQWDRCWVDAPYLPFALHADGSYDYTAPLQDAYFTHAAAVCEKIVAYGFTPALVVLWANHVPGTWASGIVRSNIMPKDLIVPYCQKVADTFNRFDPVYIISGDTDLDTPEAIEYYTLAMQEMRRLCPEAPQTMHLRGLYTYLPTEIAQGIDFYMYQSGHHSLTPEKCYTMPHEIAEQYPQKPILNAEPCYEQMGYSGNQYGRFSTREVRRAAWGSVLSGACAGITYGAHGVWNWQKPNLPANPVIGEGFDTAKPWTEAFQFAGAWDFSYLKQFLATHGILSLLPVNRIANRISGLETVTDSDGKTTMQRVFSPNTQIRMAATPDNRLSLIFAPYNTKVLLQGDYTDCTAHTIDLATRRIATPHLAVQEGVTAIEMCPFAEDVLIILEKQ